MKLRQASLLFVFPPPSLSLLLPPPSLPPSGSWMNYWRVVNKCERKAEARDPPRPGKTRGRKPQLWSIMEGTSLCLPVVILLMQCK